MDKSLHAIRQEQLENKTKKVKKKDLLKMVGQFVRKVEQKNGGYWVTGINFAGREVLINCATQDECYKNLAILNGVTIE